MAELDTLTRASDTSTQPPVVQGVIPHFLRRNNPVMTAVSQQDPAVKAEGAYKTISEVSDELNVPTHVLRFWESRFPQVKPQRMRGGRRYYRPADVDMLKKIKTLLYSQGYTIKGARKHVKDKGHEIHVEPVLPQENVAVAAPKPEPKLPVVTAESVPPAKKALPSELAALVKELKDLKKTLATFS